MNYIVALGNNKLARLKRKRHRFQRSTHLNIRKILVIFKLMITFNFKNTIIPKLVY